MPIVQCHRRLIDTVNEDYLCLGQLRAEEILDSADPDDGAATMAAYVLALIAEIRRLDEADGKHRRVLGSVPSRHGTYLARIGPARFSELPASQFRS